jgi:hypothetical protein
MRKKNIHFTMRGNGLFDFIGSLVGGTIPTQNDVSLKELIGRSDKRVKIMPIRKNMSQESNAKRQIGGLLRKY